MSGANTYARNGNSQDSNSQYVNLRPGVNLGAWRLRNYTTWSRSSDGQDKWDTIYTYAQRDIIALKSQMTLGIAVRLRTCSTAYRSVVGSWPRTTK